MTTYLHPAFEEDPSLRPIGTKHCPMALGTDHEGKRCLILSLFAALSHRVTPRAPKEETAETKNKDGKGSKGEKGKDTAGSTGGTEKSA